HTARDGPVRRATEASGDRARGADQSRGPDGSHAGSLACERCHRGAAPSRKLRLMPKRPRPLKDPVYRHRLLQVLADGALVALAFFLAFLLRFDHGIPPRYQELLEDTIAAVVVTKVAIFAAFGMYQKWWRYVGLRDIETILRAAITASLVVVGGLFIWSPTENDVPR